MVVKPFLGPNLGGDLFSVLAEVNRTAIGEVGARCPDQKIATVDQDATIIESRKQEAKATYEGSRGYQPMLAVWAETGLILSDEFRDGNVPAMMSPLSGAKVAFCALQACPQDVCVYFGWQERRCKRGSQLPG